VILRTLYFWPFEVLFSKIYPISLSVSTKCSYILFDSSYVAEGIKNSGREDGNISTSNTELQSSISRDSFVIILGTYAGSVSWPYFFIK